VKNFGEMDTYLVFTELLYTTSSCFLIACLLFALCLLLFVMFYFF
jgi:hypothetical protein